MLFKQKQMNQLEYLANFLGLFAIIIILIVAFIAQVFVNELPCPLCLLQRVGFIGIGIGFYLNVYVGPACKYYAIALLSTLYTGACALRQIVLHILPGTGSYGQPIYALHLYTWSFIIAFCFLMGITILLFIHQPLQKNDYKKWRLLLNIASILFVLVIAANVFSAFLECGLGPCPDDPTNYEILKKIQTLK